jgi:DNA (cytosine-5)-methyltransferase 1
VCGSRASPASVPRTGWLPRLNNRRAEDLPLNEALLDFSATICTLTAPRCRCCPLESLCPGAEVRGEDSRLVVDLFAGAGGLGLGVAQAGVPIAYAIERDARVARTYELNFPGTAVAKCDLGQRGTRQLCSDLGLRPGSVDILVAGPPCQGFSTSNLQTRCRDNPDNEAWESVLEFARYLRPRALIMENVLGMVSYDDGRTARLVCSRLTAMGYVTREYHLDAVMFGVPQRRKRVFFVATERGPLPERFPIRESVQVTVGEALRDLPCVPNGNTRDSLPYRLHGASLSSYQKHMRARSGRRVRNCSSSKHTELTLRRYACVPPGGNWSNIPPALFTTYSKRENCHRWLFRRLGEDAPAVTISNFRIGLCQSAKRRDCKA